MQGPSKYFTLAQELGKNPVLTNKNIQFVFKLGKSNWKFQTGECQKFLKSQCRQTGGLAHFLEKINCSPNHMLHFDQILPKSTPQKCDRNFWLIF